MLLATVDSVKLFQVTGEGAEESPLLLGSAALQLQPYSIARSSDGATIVAGEYPKPFKACISKLA